MNNKSEQPKTVFMFKSYASYKQGVNNLEVVKLVASGDGHPFKVFTSLIDKAETYARRWAKKNNINLA